MAKQKKTSEESLAKATCEEWEPIKGFEEYEVSNLGNVRRGEKIKKAAVWSLYKSVTLCKDGKPHTKAVHRLVAEAFLPNPENKPCINHIDCNKLNNRVDNLEWCTYQENERHAWEHGLKENVRDAVKQHIAYARSFSHTEKPVDQFAKSGEFVRRWDSASKAHNELGIDGSGIAKCCRGKLKTAGGFVWKYAQ